TSSALLSKAHPSIVDGASATDLISVMFDDEGAPALPAARDTWQPTPEPTGIELLAQTLTRRTFNPSEQVRTVRAAARAPRQSLGQALALLRGMAASASIVQPLGSSSAV